MTAAILLPVMASAEIICSLGGGASGAKAPSYDSSVDGRPSPDTMQLVRRVDAAFAPFCLPKCPAAALLRNTTAPNLMLAVYAEGGKIIYAPAFFAGVYGKFGETGIIALVAHVYGHAIDETTPSNWIPTKWNPELRADAWAGCALAKASLPQSGVASALAALAMYPPAGQNATPAQNGWSERLPAVRLGYTRCGGEAAKFDTASKPAPVSKPAPAAGGTKAK